MRLQWKKIRADDISASVWLIFLVIPVVLVAGLSEAGIGWDIVAYTALVVFAMVYVVIVTRVNRLRMPTRLRDAGPQLRVGILGTLAMLACTAFLLPSLRVNVVAVMPYYAAVWVWLLPPRSGTVVVLGIWCAAIGAPLVMGLLDSGAALGISVSFLFLLIFRLLYERELREARLNEELALVNEREEISRDVHDILGHSLTAINLKAQVARRLLRTEPARAETELDDLLRVTQSALDEVRQVVGRMRTPDLASQLATARTTLGAAGVSLVVRGAAADVPPAQRPLFAWAVREATTNIARHADATAARILLAPDRLDVVDDGRGGAITEGHGLTGLRRRAEDAGARLVVAAANPAKVKSGTRLTVEFSTAAADAALSSPKLFA